MLWKVVRSKERQLLENFKNLKIDVDWVDGWAKSVVVQDKASGEVLLFTQKYDNVEVHIAEPPKMVDRWEASGMVKILDETHPITKVFESEYQAKRFAEQIEGGTVKTIQVPE